MSKFYGLFDGKKSPELAAALGDMILAWTRAEESQFCAMAAMLDIDLNDAVRLYQNFPNFRSRTQALYTLIDTYPEFEPARREIEGLSKLSKTRNRYVHGSFIQSNTDPMNLRSVDFAEQDSSPNRSNPVKAADITNHADAVRRRAYSLEAILLQVPAYKVWSEKPLRASSEPRGHRNTPRLAPPPPQSSEG